MDEDDITLDETETAPADDKRADCETVSRTQLEAIRAVSKPNPDTGEFEGISATQGEAQDGHIIRIGGLAMPAKAPLMSDHWSDVMLPLLGRVTKARRVTVDGVKSMRNTHRVNLGDDGILGEIRRGMFHMIEAEDLDGLSIRWDTVKRVRRIDLDPGHEAFIDRTKVGSDDARYWGSWIEKSIGREVSVVTLGADSKALIGRSKACKSEPARTFFRGLAHASEQGLDQAGAANIQFGMRAMLDSVKGLRDLGVDDGALISLLDGRGIDELECVEYEVDGASRKVFVPHDALQHLRSESAQHSEVKNGSALLQEHLRLETAAKAAELKEEPAPVVAAPIPQKLDPVSAAKARARGRRNALAEHSFATTGVRP